MILVVTYLPVCLGFFWFSFAVSLLCFEVGLRFLVFGVLWVVGCIIHLMLVFGVRGW